jgi:integrase
VADEYLEKRIAVSGRNAKHVSQWRMTLTAYCEPIRSKPVSKLTSVDVLAVLTQETVAGRDLGAPLWTARHETASRLRGRIEGVLDYAMTKGMLTGDNPAKWQGALKGALKGLTASKPEAHHAAMPYADLPAFMRELRARPAIAARALEFAILTAARTGEVIGATWAEINLDAALWTIPAERMKAKAEHRVPLSGRALAILAEAKGDRANSEGYVFPGQRHDAPLSQMALLMLLRRMNVEATAHGFRSSFRDFAGDRTAFPRDVAEAALAHKISDRVEAAYRRGSALEKRRELMEAWASFCDADTAANVVALHATA